MLRGTIKIKCSACSHVFEALDIEDNATVMSMPVKCPKCGNICKPKKSLIDKVFWQQP